MGALRKWSYDKFGSVNKELRQVREKIEQLNLQDPHSNRTEVDTLMRRMDELFYREE